MFTDFSAIVIALLSKLNMVLSFNRINHKRILPCYDPGLFWKSLICFFGTNTDNPMINLFILSLACYTTLLFILIFILFRLSHIHSTVGESRADSSNCHDTANQEPMLTMWTTSKDWSWTVTEQTLLSFEFEKQSCSWKVLRRFSRRRLFQAHFPLEKLFIPSRNWRLMMRIWWVLDEISTRCGRSTQFDFEILSIKFATGAPLLEE